MESTKIRGLLRRQICVLRAKPLLFGFLIAGLAACGTQDVARAPLTEPAAQEPRIEAKVVDNQAIDVRLQDDVRTAKDLIAHESKEPRVLSSRHRDDGTARTSLARMPISEKFGAQENLSQRRTDGSLGRSGVPRRIGRRDAKSGIFGFDEVKLGKSEVFHKWSNALQRHTTNRVTNTLLCAKGVLSLCRSEDMVSDFDASLLSLRQSVRHLPAVNHHVNQVSYVEDWANYRERDYWAAPGEFFGNGGDCEDYAIAKYLLLRELGIDPNAMRIVVVMDQYRDTAHAVLAIYVGNDILVLDNLSRVIEPHELVDKYVPIYSLNENHAWLHTRPRTEIGLR